VVTGSVGERSGGHAFALHLPGEPARKPGVHAADRRTFRPRKQPYWCRSANYRHVIPTPGLRASKTLASVVITPPGKEETDMELHQQLTEALDKRGISRTELAHQTGFAGSTITRLLDGKVERPSWPLIRAV